MVISTGLSPGRHQPGELDAGFESEPAQGTRKPPAGHSRRTFPRSTTGQKRSRATVPRRTIRPERWRDHAILDAGEEHFREGSWMHVRGEPRCVTEAPF